MRCEWMENGNQCRAESCHQIPPSRANTPRELCCFHFEAHVEREIAWARRAVDLRIFAKRSQAKATREGIAEARLEKLIVARLIRPGHRRCPVPK
jgi:hypothetical protein